MRALLLGLLLPACFGSSDAEEPAPARESQTVPLATECVAETYAKASCGAEQGWVCNGTMGCRLAETIPLRDERATPLANQESIYWREHPAGPRYVYCCAP